MKRGEIRVTLDKSDVAILDVLRSRCLVSVCSQRALLIDPIACASIVEAINPIIIRLRRKRCSR